MKRPASSSAPASFKGFAVVQRHFDSIDHLNAEAVAALIDGELSPGAAHRARVHIVLCPDCRDDANNQRAAAEAVRTHNTDEGLRAPRSLVERLTEMGEAPLAGEPAGTHADKPRLWPSSWRGLRKG